MSHELYSYKDLFQEYLEPSFKNTIKKLGKLNLNHYVRHKEFLWEIAKMSETYSGPCQTSMRELFAKQLTVFNS